MSYFIPKQLKLPLDLERLINISDQVYTFCDVMEHTYIDGTKIASNANRYTWVWKKLTPYMDTIQSILLLMPDKVHAKLYILRRARNGETYEFHHV